MLLSRAAWVHGIRAVLFVGVAVLVLWKWGCVLPVPDVEGWACNASQDCLEPLECQEKVCRRPCFSDKDCKGGDSCTNGFCHASGESDGGTPEVICIPRAGGEICNGRDDNCDQQVDEGGVCEREGKVCEPGSQGTLSCTGGLGCTSLSLYPDRPRVCLRRCDEADPSTCPEKFLCLRAGTEGQSVCMQVRCKSDVDCVYQGDSLIAYACVRVGGTSRLCLPAYTPKGASKVGQRCSPLENVWCDALTSCTRKSTQSDGVCSVRCSTAADCPKDLTNPTCQAIEGSVQICWQGCNGNTDCGPGLQCSGSKRCEPMK